MDCRQVETLLPLAVGRDLTDAEVARDLQDHVASCPACWQLQQSLKVTQGVLEEARALSAATWAAPSEQASLTAPGASVRDRRSVWPAVKARIVDWERRPQFARFNVWVPTLAASIAVAILVGVAGVEIQRKWERAHGLIARDHGRNLFVSDPQFAESRGRQVSRDDLDRWSGRWEDTIRPVAGPPRPTFDLEPALEW